MNRQSGFTLLEILLVASFIMMLMGITMPVIDESGIASRDARRATDLRSVRQALASYHKEYGVYPTTDGEWVGDPSDFGGLDYGPAGYIVGLVPDYIPALPRDPVDEYPNDWQGYVYRSDGADYKFMAFGTPESYPNGNPLGDSARPGIAWAVNSPGATSW